MLLSNIIKNGDCQKVSLYEFKEAYIPEELEEDENVVAEEEEELTFLQETVKQYIEEAKAEAQKILETAKAEAERIRTSAYEEGKESGYIAGYEEGKKQVYEEHEEELKEEVYAWKREMETIAEDVRRAKDKCMEQHIDDLKAVTISIAEKIIQTSLKSSGEVIKRMIISATDKLKKTEWVKIYIDRFDYEKLLEVDSILAAELSYLSDNIKIIVMDKEVQGTCIVELPGEIIDISVPTQLENIKDIINNAKL